MLDGLRSRLGLLDKCKTPWRGWAKRAGDCEIPGHRSISFGDTYRLIDGPDLTKKLALRKAITGSEGDLPRGLARLLRP